MGTLAELLQILLLPIVCGCGLLRSVGLSFRSDRLGYFAWAYLGGTLLMAPFLLAWCLLGRPISGGVLGAGLLLGSLMLAWLSRERAQLVSGRASDQPWDRYLLWTCCALLMLFFFDQMMAAALTPVSYGDEANIWAAKAHALFDPGAQGLAISLQSYVLHADYPLLNPLVQTWAFAVHGSIDPFLGRVAIQIYVFALILAAAAALARYLRGSLVALLLVVLFVNEGTIQQASWACSDLMLSLGLLVGVDAWLRWREEGRNEWLALHVIGICTVLWSKNEGLMLGLLWFTILWLFESGATTRKGQSRATLLVGQLLPCLVVVAIGVAFNAIYGLGNDLFNPNIGDGGGLWQRLWANVPARALPVAEHFFGELMDAEKGRYLVLCFLLLALGMGSDTWKHPTRLPFLLVLGGLFGYLAIFVATNRVLAWHLETAASRVIYQLMPVATLGLAMVLSEQARFFRGTAESKFRASPAASPAGLG